MGVVFESTGGMFKRIQKDSLKVHFQYSRIPNSQFQYIQTILDVDSLTLKIQGHKFPRTPQSHHPISPHDPRPQQAKHHGSQGP